MFSKGFIPGLLMVLLASYAFAQPSAAESDTAIVQQKIYLVKSGLQDEFDEDQFRSIFLEFVSERKKNIRCSFLTLNNLAKLASGDEANSEFFDCLNSLLVHSENDILIKKKYFARIADEMNELVALQFLDVERIAFLVTSSKEFHHRSDLYSHMAQAGFPTQSCFTILSDPLNSPTIRTAEKEFITRLCRKPWLASEYFVSVGFARSPEGDALFKIDHKMVGERHEIRTNLVAEEPDFVPKYIKLAVRSPLA